MKFKLNKKISSLVKICILFVSFINIKSTKLNAEESYLNEIEFDSSTKIDTDSSALPTNPFELVEMIRRANSMNDATKPSDAIDDALKLFNKIEVKETP
ncbi:conserved hypothetical protein [Prochlorococcus marinus subsp. pastoris str. CCMP1986]|uniref:Uncharacterized protein n=1 Tax=Prochlorococcus marinus subsp. pastoris (strain CCMP1986 / NIES-2087 / MED4) TaxID=59919 RepID=Q7V2J1_PROMP|nr:hypothetical protein PROCH_1669 [Prochlorococcus marinus str. EQPAC1]CAE18944.1 conserved hypothetical protein [Prochlorococcus marinus subsp. pastoris str. CCMP1986]